ncbi:MAG: cation diffusion facilitator family transporter [Candidatus Aminicenantes bacterium]|nr:cation diffusion facilitator family transporter [Candidatus Aminicenantes bacterium]
MQQESKKAVVAALICNFCIAAFKFAAALLSGSSSMLAEAYHSVSDTFNQILLLIGLKSSRRKADAGHPFGHGQNQFFWSFMVAIILFAVAGGLSIREGTHKLLHPEPITKIWLAYLAIAVAVFFESLALRMAIQSIKAEMKKEKHENFFHAIRDSKDPTILTVLFEDSLALAGLAIAAVAITLVQITGELIIDAIASIVIGTLLMVFAFFLAVETKKLLIGESMSSLKRTQIIEVVNSFDEVVRVIRLKSMHLSSDDVLVVIEIEYSKGLVVEELEKINDRIEAKIEEILPNARVYLEPEDK